MGNEQIVQPFGYQESCFCAALDRPWLLLFPMAHSVNHIDRAIPPPSYRVGPFIVCIKQNLLLTGVFHKTHRSGAQASAGCSSKNSFCHLHMLTNIWASQTLSTRSDREDMTFPRSLPPSVQRLPQWSQHLPEEYLNKKEKQLTFNVIKQFSHIICHRKNPNLCHTGSSKR